jgi:putative membrane protein
VPPEDPPEIDYRFSLANERTFLAWIRTTLALLAGGVAAAKALEFHSELARWLVAGPPLAAGALLGADAVRRWRAYEDAMRAGRRLPAGRGLTAISVAVSIYAIVALIAIVLDG